MLDTLIFFIWFFGSVLCVIVGVCILLLVLAIGAFVWVVKLSLARDDDEPKEQESIGHGALLHHPGVHDGGAYVVPPVRSSVNPS